MNVRSGSNAQSLRSAPMNAYASQPNPRTTPRLQNSHKTGLGNGNAGAGWAFGAPSGVFGGLGGAPGLGQGRPGQLSGFAQVMGGGGGQGPIDMSDFPTLAGPARAQPQTSWNSNAIRQQPAPQPTVSQALPAVQAPSQRAPSTAPSHQSLDQYDGTRSQQAPADRGAGGDEFPPLNTQPVGESMRNGNGFPTPLASPDDLQSPSSGQPMQLPIRETSSTTPAASLGTIGPNSSSTTQPAAASAQTPGQSLPSTASTNSKSKAWAEMTPSERYGLPGLSKRFETLKMRETGGQIDPTLPPAERNVALTMGQDLSTLDMNLDSQEPLHKTFHPFPDLGGSASIFDSKTRQPVPDFNVPPAYHVNNVPPMHTRLNAFSDETLLAVFFQHPKDQIQEQCAAELTRREYRWHRVLRQWMQQDTRENNSLPIIDRTNGAPIGILPRAIDKEHEQGVYIFFDHQNWRRERREFILNLKEIDENIGAPSAGLAGHQGGGNLVEATGAGLGGGVVSRFSAAQQPPMSGVPRQNSIVSGGNDG